MLVALVMTLAGGDTALALDLQHVKVVRALPMVLGPCDMYFSKQAYE